MVCAFLKTDNEEEISVWKSKDHFYNATIIYISRIISRFTKIKTTNTSTNFWSYIIGIQFYQFNCIHGKQIYNTSEFTKMFVFSLIHAKWLNVKRPKLQRKFIFFFRPPKYTISRYNNNNYWNTNISRI